MPFARPTRTTLLTDAVSYIQTAAWNGNSTVPLPNSILYILAQLIAYQVDTNCAYLDWIATQATPWKAEGEYLEGWANLKNITRNVATYATGSVSFTGTTGVVIPSGTILATADANTFTTQADYTVGTSTSVAIQAATAGSGGNYAITSTISLRTPVTGVTGASLTTAISGGVDAESDDSLKIRMMAAYQTQPTGGSQADFQNWLLAVPGVTRAWCDPAPPSQTVTVYAMMDIIEAANDGFLVGTNGGSTWDTRPTVATGDQLTIANALWPYRPVCSSPLVVSPTPQHVALRITPLITNDTTTQAAITAAIQAMLLVKNTALGYTLYQSDITAAISSVADVTEFVLQSFTDLAIPVGSLAVVDSTDISWT